MAGIDIIGGGSFGTALAQALSANDHAITIHTIEKDVADDINSNHRNSKYFRKAKLSRNIRAETGYCSLKQSDIIILTIPSSAIVPVCRDISSHFSGQPIISCSKGITPDGKTMTDIIKKELTKDVLALSGPSIADEIISGKPTKLILGGKRQLTSRIKDIIQTENLIIDTTTDIDGIQYLGYHKNVIAIIVGICNALETGQNFKSSIVSKAYSDFYYNNIDRIYRHTFVDAAGLGDLFVTTMSEHSRNQRFGFLLGCGKSIQEAKIEIGQTIEGWDNISRFLEKKHVPDHIIDENLLHVFRNISEETPDKGRLFTLLRDYLGKIKIKAIVTDWGGVLTKDLYVGKAAKLLADKYGLDAGKLAAYLDRTEKRLLRGEETFEDYYHRVNRLGFSLEEFRDAYQNAYTKNQEMVELLIRFRKKMKVYILSNNYDFLMMKMKKDYGGICDDMFFSNEIGAIKPDTKIFMALLEKTRLRPQQCIFIDDVEENIDAARELNFNAVLFKDVNQCRNDIRKIIRM